MNTRGEWFWEVVADPVPSPIAYFSGEYGLHHSLPLYAVGLGFVAADHLKECSDLGVPLVAVGFMYPGGYVRQKILDDGWQEDTHETVHRDAAPTVRILDENGKQLLVRVPLIDLKMPYSKFHFPIRLPFVLIFPFLFVSLFLLFQIVILGYAHEKIGINPR